MTKQARGTTAAVTRFPLRDGKRPPDAWEVLGNLEMYEIDRPQTVTISANEMCNLFVHSLIFKLAWTVGGLPAPDYWLLTEDDPRLEEDPMEVDGFFVASDKSSAEHLTFVNLGELVRVFRVLANEVTMVTNRRDLKGRMHSTAT